MQQINLYQPILRRPKPVFSASAIAQTLVLVTAGLLLIQGYGAWRVASLSDSVQQLRASRDTAEGAYQELMRRQPRREPDPQLQQQVEQLAADLDRARVLAEALGSGAFGNASGLSEYLLGLARQHEEGLWLTRIVLDAGGEVIGLDGRSLSPEAVPGYLQRLSSEAAFKGKAFGHLELSRGETALDFRIATTRPAAGGTDVAP